MRQSTELSEDEVRKSMGGVSDFLRMEENDESPGAKDTVSFSVAAVVFVLEVVVCACSVHCARSGSRLKLNVCVRPCSSTCSSWPRFLGFKPV